MNNFFFKRIDPKAFGVFRITFYLSFLFFYNKYFYLEFLQWFDSYYSPFFQPISFFKFLNYDNFISLRFDQMKFFWNLSVLFAAVGLFYPVSSLMSFLGLLYMAGIPLNFGKVHHVHHLPVIIFGFLSMGFRAGSFALDNLFKTEKRDPTIWPLRMAQMYMCILYFSSGFQKLKNTGIDWVFSDNMQSIILTRPTVTEFGVWIAKIPYAGVILSLITISAQLLAPLALFYSAWRMILVPTLFLLHIGTYLTLGNHGYFFPYNVCFLVWLPWEKFLPSFKLYGALLFEKFPILSKIVQRFYTLILFPLLQLLIKIKFGNSISLYLRHSILSNRFNPFFSDIDFSVVLHEPLENPDTKTYFFIKLRAFLPMFDYPEVYTSKEWDFINKVTFNVELNYLWSFRKEGWILKSSQNSSYEKFKQNRALKFLKSELYETSIGLSFTLSDLKLKLSIPSSSFKHLCMYSPYLELTNESRVWELSFEEWSHIVSLLPSEIIKVKLNEGEYSLKKELWIREYLTSRSHYRVHSCLGEDVAHIKEWIIELEEKFEEVFNEKLQINYFDFKRKL